MNENKCKLPDEKSYKQVTIFTKHYVLGTFMCQKQGKMRHYFVVRRTRASDALKCNNNGVVLKDREDEI